MMRKIAEKFEFMNSRAVKICVKVGIGRKVRHKKPCIRSQFSIKPPRKRKSLTVQGVFDKIIDVVQENRL